MTTIDSQVKRINIVLTKIDDLLVHQKYGKNQSSYDEYDTYLYTEFEDIISSCVFEFNKIEEKVNSFYKEIQK